jgi:hypothetical protein
VFIYQQRREQAKALSFQKSVCHREFIGVRGSPLIPLEIDFNITLLLSSKTPMAQLVDYLLFGTDKDQRQRKHDKTAVLQLPRPMKS